MLHLAVLNINLAFGATLQGRANFFMDDTNLNSSSLTPLLTKHLTEKFSQRVCDSL
jgi:hypothetical protein